MKFNVQLIWCYIVHTGLICKDKDLLQGFASWHDKTFCFLSIEWGLHVKIVLLNMTFLDYAFKIMLPSYILLQDCGNAGSSKILKCLFYHIWNAEVILMPSWSFAEGLA